MMDVEPNFLCLSPIIPKEGTLKNQIGACDVKFKDHSNFPINCFLPLKMSTLIPPPPN